MIFGKLFAKNATFNSTKFQARYPKAYKLYDVLKTG